MLRKIYLAPLDIAERLARRPNEMTPARATNFTGAVSDFRASGDTLLQRLIARAGVTPVSHVLDVGCGMGRLGAAMAGFLDASGGYHGLDIVPEGIKWCRENISSPYGNVLFTLADILNKEYNPSGKIKAAEYRFPFDGGTFDAAVLISVFTHLNAKDAEHYVSEIARVLRPGGVCYASFCLLTPDSLRLMRTSTSSYNFRYRLGDYWSVSRTVPEMAIAYEEQFMCALYQKYGLVPHLYPGEWYCGGGPGEQDILLGRKQ
jgi:SAM-dependent methyltransferase